MGRTACTDPQCLYSTAIPLLPLWAVRPVQSLSASTRVHFTLLYMYVYKRVYVCVCAPLVAAAAPTEFVVWLRACSGALS